MNRDEATRNRDLSLLIGILAALLGGADLLGRPVALGAQVVHLQRALGISRTQLHNKIKALTGQSTTEFVRMIRLNKARELLQSTELNVSEVGYEVGISNPAYFSRMFRRKTGESPLQFRRRLRAG